MSPPPSQFDGGGTGGSGRKSVVNRFTPLEFSGTGLQLFGVQLLNILLTCLTFGIWIPWARVRKRRFFYNNTRLFDDGFDYLATGFDIFKGWVIVTLIAIAYYALPVLGVPFLMEVLSLLLVFIYPWAINRSLRFNARSIAWRDVRFDFKGSYLGSLWFFFLLPILGILTLGLLMPFASKGMRDYVAHNYSFGSAAFFCDASLGSYYGAGLKTALLFLILFLLLPPCLPRTTIPVTASVIKICALATPRGCQHCRVAARRRGQSPRCPCYRCRLKELTS